MFISLTLETLAVYILEYEFILPRVNIVIYYTVAMKSLTQPIL